MQLEQWLDKTQRTITGFAAESGFSVSSVWRWVHSERIPSLEAIAVIERISKRKVTARDFINGRRQA